MIQRLLISVAFTIVETIVYETTKKLVNDYIDNKTTQPELGDEFEEHV